ncbi:hypothetical protein POPTR_014G095450v4 [Populus trichocarpa]|uniref:Uncharacterized protein n=1 Tax=Populus trichocarpa TaxID=3694 RepID=A0ACC0RXZ4_POPTR|nr:hypothetical protein POPTR_014G095450v4 [Populus trichocarpa]
MPDCWWRFPRPASDLVAGEGRRLKRGPTFGLHVIALLGLCGRISLLQVASAASRGRRSNHSFQTRPGTRPGFRVLTGSPSFDWITGSSWSNFFLNQNDVVLVKKKTKINWLQPGHIGFFLPLFFLEPDPVPTSSWPGPGSTRQAGFQNYGRNGAFEMASFQVGNSKFQCDP